MIHGLSLALVRWQSPQMLGIALLVGVGIVLSVVLLYPAQVRDLPARWRWGLPVLRCAGLMALAASVARPVFNRTIAETDPGAYVIVLDQSRSMSVVDGHRREAGLVALADGLGKLPIGVRLHSAEFQQVSSRIEELRGAHESIGQSQVEFDIAQLQGRDTAGFRRKQEEYWAQFARIKQELSKMRGLVLPRSNRLETGLNELAKLPAPQSKQWAAQSQKVVAELTVGASEYQAEFDLNLHRKNQLVRAACEQLAGKSRIELAAQFLNDPAGGLIAQLPGKAVLQGYAIGSELRTIGLRKSKDDPMIADMAGSDLSGGMAQLRERLGGRETQAVVLFSDGLQVNGKTDAGEGWSESKAPVFTVMTAPSGAAPDVAMERVTLPASLFVGETLSVTAHLRWTGVKTKPQEVTLQIGERTHTAKVRVNDNSNDIGVAVFSVVMDEAGPRELTLRTNRVEGELTVENNSARRWVKVLSDRFDVLLVGGAPSWDYRYLRNALARAPWINLGSALVDGETRVLDWRAEKISRQDVVVLCDVPAKGLSDEQWEAVRKVVAVRGGSVILLAGQAHLPAQYGGDVLAELLPFKASGAGQEGGPVWRKWPGEEPAFRIVPAAADGLAGMMLGDTPAESAERWLGLPPVFRYLALPALKETATPLLVERDTQSPVLVRHKLGRGSAYFLGVDETWRWRFKNGARDQERFFRELIRMAADEPYAMINDTIALDAERIVIAPNQSLRVRAKILNPDFLAGSPATMDLDVTTGDSVVRNEALPAVGEPGSGRFEGYIAGLEAGKYILRLRGPDGSDLEYPLQVAVNMEAEMANVSPDEDRLRRIASGSGGEFCTLEQVKNLGAKLSKLGRSGPRTIELRLWDSWYLYAFVVACLGAEWAVRKRVGLV